MTAASTYSAKIQGRRNSAKLKAKYWNPRNQNAVRRSLEKADTPFSDAELIEQAIAAGKLSRLPAGVADGAALAIRRGDWR